MPQVHTAKNGARYIRLPNGKTRFVSKSYKGGGKPKGRKKKGRKGGSAAVGGSAKVGGGLVVTRAYRAVGRASKSIRSAVSKALY